MVEPLVTVSDFFSGAAVGALAAGGGVTGWDSAAGGGPAGVVGAGAGACAWPKARLQLKTMPATAAGPGRNRRPDMRALSLVCQIDRIGGWQATSRIQIPGDVGVVHLCGVETAQIFAG